MVLNAGNEQALTEWEFIPPVGPRPIKGFVGLKNAGATCYMNSVTQQVSINWLFLLIFLTAFIVTSAKEGGYVCSVCLSVG